MNYAMQLVDHYASVRRRLGLSVVAAVRPQRIAALPGAVVLAAPKIEDAPPREAFEGCSAPLNMLAPCSMRFLVTYAALASGVSVADIFGTKRFKDITAARHRAIGLVYQHTQASLSATGRLFGRDHSTVLHALAKIEKRYKLVDLLPSTYEANRAAGHARAVERARLAKARQAAITPKAVAVEAQKAARKQKLPPRSEDPHTPRSNLQKAIARAYRNGVPTENIVEAYGTTAKSVHVIAHNLGLKRKNTVAKSKADWVARGMEVAG